MAEIYVGIDIGAVTIKSVALNENKEIVFSSYEKHFSQPRKYIANILSNLSHKFPKDAIRLSFSGSSSIDVAASLQIDFQQEVIACKKASDTLKNQPNIIIDIGGEDAKIIFLGDDIEYRMNNSCAAGTGAFLEQMTDLLNISMTELNDMAKESQRSYALASRCSVFTKTDIQNLLSQGVSKNDIAGSLLNCIVNQVITVLACGRKITGNVGFAGGVFKYLPELKNAFKRRLKINVIDIKDSQLFVAFGAALLAQDVEIISCQKLIGQLENLTNADHEAPFLPALFKTNAEREDFYQHHPELQPTMLDTFKDNEYFLGVDAGSTTTKLAVIDCQNRIVYSDYKVNNGENLKTLESMLEEMYDKIPKEKIAFSGITGYGEVYLKNSLEIDVSEVETIAHLKAAAHNYENVDSIIDIGGQDVKFIRLKNGNIDKLLINEACSSGAGVFLQNFSNSLNIDIKNFAKLAFSSKTPYDLGTRCTVFMNSKVRQAQKEGAEISDILAGLAYSAVKNTLNKVIKIRNNDDLGKNVVVQGGTFKNDAVLRAFENLTGIIPYRGSNPELMGAFGMALIAKEQVQEKTKSHIETELLIPNAYQFKRENIFNYTPLLLSDAPRGIIGLPRVLNMYENYPFWFSFFTKLGFRVELSNEWTRETHNKGLTSVPSETVCFSAKSVHGHIENLIEKNIKLIFYPCIPLEKNECKGADKNFNCPIVATYPEVIKNNIELPEGVDFVGEFLPLGVGNFVNRILEISQFSKFNFSRAEINSALKLAKQAQAEYKQKLYNYGEKSLKYIKANNIRAIVLASRPYFIANEISHGIDKVITDMDMAVLTEDTICHLSSLAHPLRIVDQWTYTTRIFNACDVVCKEPNLELVQLTAFGCGIDAIVSEQAEEILEHSGKIYTLIKLDESANLNSVKIRLRSSKYAAESKKANYKKYTYRKVDFTKSMSKKHTIIAPQLHPLHSKYIQTAINDAGYNIEILDVITQHAIELGLKYVNNDICYPATIVIGQLLEAALSGKYDTHNITLVISQSGCGCRDSNYIPMLRKALGEIGLGHIPVLSFNYVGLEKVSGFKFTMKMNYQLLMGTIYSDLLTQLLLAVRPYEAEKGLTNQVYEKWVDVCNQAILKPRWKKFRQNLQSILREFSEIETHNIQKPKIAIAGETYLKYNTNSNKDLISILENEGCEVVFPSIMSFIEFVTSREISSHRFLGNDPVNARLRAVALKVMLLFHKVLQTELSKYPQFMQSTHFDVLINQIEKVVSHANQNGEGWYLPSKIMDLLEHDVNNVICVQPFGCLSNHVLGRGTMKRIKELYPKANIMPLDYDGSISEANQINRIKMLVSLAKAMETERNQL